MPQDINTTKDKIISLCACETAIAAAYVFGSHAQGKEKKSSDIDVAILLNETRMAEFSTLDFITALEKEMECRTDVVILNKADEVLKYEVRHKGVLLYERSSEYRKQFEIKSRKFYEDFLYLHKKYIDKVLYGGMDG